MGLILTGCTIDHILVSSPAYRSQQLADGDVILEVDGVEATEDNVAQLLRGADEPDTSVELKVRRKEFGGWQNMTTTVLRASASEIADISRLLQLFTQIHKHMKKIGEAGIVEQAVDLWKQTEEHHDKIARSAAALRQQKITLLVEMRESLQNMNKAALADTQVVIAQERGWCRPCAGRGEGFRG